MKNKKGADGGAGGRVEVGIKVISPSVVTLQQLKEEARERLETILKNEIYGEAESLIAGQGWEEKIYPIKFHFDSAIEKAYAAEREEARAEIVEEVEKMKQEKPRRVCLNAETKLFGRCFDCVKVDGYNKALADVLSALIKK